MARVCKKEAGVPGMIIGLESFCVTMFANGKCEPGSCPIYDFEGKTPLSPISRCDFNDKTYPIEDILNAYKAALQYQETPEWQKIIKEMPRKAEV